MDQKLRAVLRRERRIKMAAVLSVLVMGLVILLAVDNLLISFVLAFVTNYLLSPIVNFLERKHVPRQAAIMIPFFLTACIVGFCLYLFVPRLTLQLSTLESQLPKYQVDLMNLAASTELRFKGFLKLYNVNFSDTINTWIINRTSELSSQLPSAVSGSLTVLLLAPFFAFFMLQDGRAVSRRLLAMVPNNLFEPALNLHHQLNEQMGGFIRARFLEAAIVGFVVWIGLQLAGFPYASILALFAAVTNLIPYVGPIIGAVPAILIALISDEATMTQAVSLNLILVTSIYFFAQLVDVVFIIPLVVAKIVNLHPVTVVIVIIIGSQVMGILGMVISIPVASAIKLIFGAVYDQLLDNRT
jgi:putative permease